MQSLMALILILKVQLLTPFLAVIPDGVFLQILLFLIRERLPCKQGYEISHAPQAPYICPIGVGNFTCSDTGFYNGYSRLLRLNDSSVSTVLDAIDFISVQYYPEGNVNSCPGCPIQDWYSATVNGFQLDGTLFQIPAYKLVMGSLACPLCGGSGYFPPAILQPQWANMIAEYLEFGGVMAWEFGRDVNDTWWNSTKDGVPATNLKSNICPVFPEVAPVPSMAPTVAPSGIPTMAPTPVQDSSEASKNFDLEIGLGLGLPALIIIIIVVAVVVIKRRKIDDQV